MLIGWKSAKVFPRCYFEPSRKTRMRSVEALGSGAGQTFSADCQSSLSFPWWLPVITTLHVEATLVLTASHHYCSHDDCQSSLLFPWWLPVITTLSTLKQHLCWLPVIIIVSMMTSSHHNKRNRGIPCEEPISVQWLAVTSHSCWLEACTNKKVASRGGSSRSSTVLREATCERPTLCPSSLYQGQIVTIVLELGLWRCSLSCPAPVILSLCGWFAVFSSTISDLGHDQVRYSLHSLRRGGTSFCFNAGVRLGSIKTHGDWYTLNAVVELLPHRHCVGATVIAP